MIRRCYVLPSVGRAEISPEVAKLSRRRFLRNGLSLGSLALLTGCDLSTHSGIDAALWAMLRFDDRVQSALYNPQRLAETYPASAITRPFRFNAYYPIWEVRPVPEMAPCRHRAGCRQDPVDGRPIARPAAASSDHPAHLYRRMEPDRAVERCAAAPLSAPRRRGSAGALCRLHLL
jgi:hypothetical protein